MLLEGKAVIIAGGAGLLGTEFARAALEHGARVVVADYQEENGRRALDSLGKTFGPERISYYRLDITSKDSIAGLIRHTTGVFGKIDALVNSAYPRNKNWGKKFEDVTYEDFCENNALHLGGYFLLAQQMCLFYKKQGFGNIVNIASIQGVMAPKFDTYRGIIFNGKEMTSPVEYSAIKAAIIHMTRYMAKYFKGTSIRCNCISPGGILGGQPEEFLERYREYCTSKGMLDPVDLSGTMVYLVSDLSIYVNGQNIIVDDGWTL